MTVKFLFSVILIFANALFLLGQESGLPSQKYNNAEFSFKKLRESTAHFSAGYGYHQTIFLNPEFSKYSSSGDLQHLWWHSFHLAYTKYACTFDVNYFMSKFNVNDTYAKYYYYKDSSDFKIKHRGFDVSFSLRLVPSTRNWTKYFMPYAGLGYSFSNLVATTDVPNGDSSTSLDVVRSRVNTNALIWKTGFNVHLNTNFVIRLEYKQAFNDVLLAKYPFQELNAVFLISTN